MTPTPLSTAMQEAAERYSQGYPVNFYEEARKVLASGVPSDPYAMLHQQLCMKPEQCSECDRIAALHRPVEQAERIADLVSSLECEKRMRKDAEEEMERMREQAGKGWQPIETAPKDGTHILLANKAGVSEGGWLTDIDHGADWEGQLGAAGWWRADGTDWPPTHWQPLPTPPIDSAKGESNDHESR